MKLLYAVVNQSSYAMKTDGDTWSLLSSDVEVTPSYGFESPDDDNRWIFEHCGIRVYRSYLYFADAYCVAVFEPYGETALTDGYEWVAAERLASCEAEGISAIFHAQNGFKSKTAPWLGEGSITAYLNWAETVLTDMGYTVQRAIQQVKNAYVSTIFRIPTDAGAMYLKIASSVYVNSAAVEQQLTESMGGMPEFVAVSPDGYAAITKEMPGQDCQSGNVAKYRSWLEKWSQMQAKAAGENIYGLIDCSPQKLLAGVSGFEQQVSHILKLINRPLPEQDRRMLNIKLADVRTALEQLCKYPIPNTLCHADIRPGNVRIMEEDEVLYDWGMAFYGHPFYDALHFLHVVRRQLTEGQKAEIIDVYLSQWEHCGDKHMLRDAYLQAERCMDYFMLTADCRWVAEILDACGGIPPKGTIDNWLLGKRFYYFDRVLHRFISE